MALALYGSPAAVREVEALLGVTMTGGALRIRARRFVAWRTQMWRAIAVRGAGSISEIDALFAQYADEQIVQWLAPSRLLSWDELAGLHQVGFRIGNHAQRHLELDVLPREIMRDEVRDAQRAIRKMLGRDEPIISYPRGRTGPAVLEEVAAAGYRWGLTTVPGRIYDRQPSLMTPRVLVPPQPGIPELIWRTSRFRLWARRYAKPLVG
jgi:peptidoglycan/xylan/chitin deacetylase (PgdA/CDA1 family)